MAGMLLLSLSYDDYRISELLFSAIFHLHGSDVVALYNYRQAVRDV